MHPRSNHPSRLLMLLLALPLLVAQARATIIVSTSTAGGCAPAPGKTTCPLPVYDGGLIINGDFGTGTFSGFSGTATQNKDITQGGVFGNAATSYYVLLASAGTSQTLSQTFATTPGSLYSISFQLRNTDNGFEQSLVPGGPTYAFSAAFGDQPFLSLTNPAFPANYNKYTFNFNAIADSSTTTLLFTARNDPGGFQLSNVSAFNVTPEPESLVLLGTAALGLFGIAKRRVSSKG